jgi:hypothetical protein
MASIRQWDTDWMDQFKTIFPTNFTNLQVHPGDPIGWINKVPVAFGNKQAQRALRNPDQRIQIAKEVEYKDKYAARLTQVADMPALFDSLRIDEEYYAGDVVNAVGHVGDLFTNFNDGLAQFAYVGTSIDPLAYGLLDYPNGTAGTVVRPEQVAPVTTAGAWTTPSNTQQDIANLEAALIDKNFHGEKLLLAPTRLKPFLNLMLSNTAVPVSYAISTIGGYPIVFSEWVDADATTDAFDIYMVDRNGFDLFTTPLTVRGFFDNNTEDFVWHWKTRAYLLAKPKNDGTEWLKGIVKCTVDWNGA